MAQLKILQERRYAETGDVVGGFDYFSHVSVDRLSAIYIGENVSDAIVLDAGGADIGEQIEMVFKRPAPKEGEPRGLANIFGRKAVLTRLSVDNWELQLTGFVRPEGTEVRPADITYNDDTILPLFPLWGSGETLALPTNLTQHVNSKPTDRETLVKYAIPHAYNALEGWKEGLLAETGFHNPSHIQDGLTYLFNAMRCLEMICRGIAPFNNLIYTDKITVCYQVARGAADVTSVADFLETTGIDSPPNFPSLWVNPGTGARINLNAVRDLFKSGATYATVAERNRYVTGGYRDYQWANLIT